MSNVLVFRFDMLFRVVFKFCLLVCRLASASGLLIESNHLFVAIISLAVKSFFIILNFLTVSYRFHENHVIFRFGPFHKRQLTGSILILIAHAVLALVAVVVVAAWGSVLRAVEVPGQNCELFDFMNYICRIKKRRSWSSKGKSPTESIF